MLALSELAVMRRITEDEARRFCDAVQRLFQDPGPSVREIVDCVYAVSPRRVTPLEVARALGFPRSSPGGGSNQQTLPTVRTVNTTRAPKPPRVTAISEQATLLGVGKKEALEYVDTVRRLSKGRVQKHQAILNCMAAALPQRLSAAQVAE